MLNVPVLTIVVAAIAASWSRNLTVVTTARVYRIYGRPWTYAGTVNLMTDAAVMTVAAAMVTVAGGSSSAVARRAAVAVPSPLAVAVIWTADRMAPPLLHNTRARMASFVATGTVATAVAPAVVVVVRPARVATATATPVTRLVTLVGILYKQNQRARRDAVFYTRK